MPVKSSLYGTRFASVVDLGEITYHHEGEPVGYAEDQVYLRLDDTDYFSCSLNVSTEETWETFARIAGTRLLPYQKEILRQCANKKEERHMKMSEEMALRLHLMMRGDMKKELGDYPSASDRELFKKNWVDKNFPEADVKHNCFLCERSRLSMGMLCTGCPIKWGEADGNGFTIVGCNTCANEVRFTTSPISQILALPARNPELQHIVDEFNTKDPDKCGREAYLSVRVSQLEEEVNELRKTLAEVKEELSDASGLSSDKTVFEHIEAIKDEGVKDTLIAIGNRLHWPEEIKGQEKKGLEAVPRFMDAIRRQGYEAGVRDISSKLDEAYQRGINESMDKILKGEIESDTVKKIEKKGYDKAVDDGYMTCLNDLWKAAGCPDEPFKDALGAHSRIEEYARRGYISKDVTYKQVEDSFHNGYEQARKDFMTSVEKLFKEE